MERTALGLLSVWLVGIESRRIQVLGMILDVLHRGMQFDVLHCDISLGLLIASYSVVALFKESLTRRPT